MSTDILMLAPGPPVIMDQLARDFRFHKLWEAPDREVRRLFHVAHSERYMSTDPAMSCRVQAAASIGAGSAASSAAANRILPPGRPPARPDDGEGAPEDVHKTQGTRYNRCIHLNTFILVVLNRQDWSPLVLSSSSLNHFSCPIDSILPELVRKHFTNL